MERRGCDMAIYPTNPNNINRDAEAYPRLDYPQIRDGTRLPVSKGSLLETGHRTPSLSCLLRDGCSPVSNVALVETQI